MNLHERGTHTRRQRDARAFHDCRLAKEQVTFISCIPLRRATAFPMAPKTVERIIQGYSKRALGFAISWHSLRTTYVSRSVELEQSPVVVMANTGDSPATILKYYAKLPEVVMRRFVDGKPVIPGERV